MAHQVYWPNKYYFYPFGNTSAVSLTRDLPPREPVALLLLGCGDPRNVLYTIFCESKAARKLDFTCCDWDPGVLARNILLLTLILDNKPQEQLWDIFFHLYLDKDSNALLVSQCHQLIELAESEDSWKASKYGALIRFSTLHTLAELRRFWQLYAGMSDLAKTQYDAIATKFRTNLQSIRAQNKGHIRISRSAGPLGAYASSVCTTLLDRYWEKGVTSMDGAKARSTTVVNPTFVYSRGEDATSVHYGLDPTAVFHLTVVFGNSPDNAPSPGDVVRDIMGQFAAWCAAYRTASTHADPPVIRMHLGDALALPYALSIFQDSGALDTGVSQTQWSAEQIHLSAAEYTEGRAPTSFDVIDTSNLTDHIGLLNVLSASAPLLASSCAVLYTETLLFDADSDLTKHVLSLLIGDFPSTALMMDLCPVDYLSGYTSRSFVDGIIASSTMGKPDGMYQLQQVLTWKRPASGDALAVSGAFLTLEDEKLAALLYHLYQSLFSKYEIKALRNRTAEHASSLTEHYTRESFVLFAKLVCDRLRLDSARRRKILDSFLDLQAPDLNGNPIDMLYVQDLYLQLYRHGLYAVDVFKMPNPRTARFSRWSGVPDLVRLVLAVPRSKLNVLNGASFASSTPPIECQILTPRSNCIFSSIHLVYGRISDAGTPAVPIPSVRADPLGWKGRDPLLVSFVISARLLTVLNKPDDVRVCFTLRATPDTTKLVLKLGPRLMIHEAKFMDEQQVFVFPEATRAPTQLPSAPSELHAPAAVPLQELGTSSIASAQLDDRSQRIATLTCRVSVTEAEAKEVLQSSKTAPTVSQTSPCALRVEFAKRRQDAVFPFPVVGSQLKVKIARKSSYIEVVVPLSGGSRPDGMAVDRFAVARSPSTGTTYPWNMHRVDISTLPVVTTAQNSSTLWTWLNSHVSLALSARESALRARKAKDVMMFVKDTMHSIYYHACGASEGNPKHIFQLMDGEYCDMVLFIDKLRYDPASYTVVCDAFFMHLHPSVNDRIVDGMGDILRTGDEMNVRVKIYEGESEAWKTLLPAFAERCRAWEHTANCEYAAQGRIPLSTERESNPLCTCGRGKDVEGSIMMRPKWKKLAPMVTRVAISPIFSVPYLEPLRDFSALASEVTGGAADRCARCSRTSGKDGGGLKTCARCHLYKYCSAECQRADWKSHKALCGTVSS